MPAGHFNRLFLIGLPKTGTHSMMAALERLGWVRHKIDSLEYYRTGRMEVPEGCFVADEAQRDYWYLDDLYPAAGFILMDRDRASWLASLEAHMKARPPDADSRRLRRIGILGLLNFNRDYHNCLYERHFHEVAEFFNHGRNFHVHRLGREGYPELCDWLGVPAIDEPWPHENRSAA